MSIANIIPVIINAENCEKRKWVQPKLELYEVSKETLGTEAKNYDGTGAGTYVDPAS